MSETKISAFIICKNEEGVIENALKSLTWADEIIVVDGESTDNTQAIARKYTDKVFIRGWTNFGEQRNFALNHTKHPWVFFLDADEVCSVDLINWLTNFKKKGEEWAERTAIFTPSVHPLGEPKTPRVDLYEIRRWEHFRGQLYRYGAANPSHQWRFFRREGANFTGEVHEYPVVQGRILRIEFPIYHYPRATLAQMMDKMNRYSTLEAEQLFKRGVKHGPSYMLFSGLAQFSKAFFRKRGFRDGTLGFILAVLEASGFFLRQAKLYLKNQKLTK
ncbi:MAG: glycosyltransferase family 2 protein [Oligoflexia bacterium]|nr:glycosyltransferase family 2 protein [Oligoflexia bacterium]